MSSKHKNDLANYRIEKAKEKIKSALDLLKCGDYADSVSRSYYAIFSAARALLALKELDSKKHSGVISLFNQHFVAAGVISKESGKMLKVSKSFREEADYSDFVTIDEEDAQNELENAEKFVAEVDQKLEQLIKEQE